MDDLSPGSSSSSSSSSTYADDDSAHEDIPRPANEDQTRPRDPQNTSRHTRACETGKNGTAGGEEGGEVARGSLTLSSSSSDRPVWADGPASGMDGPASGSEKPASGDAGAAERFQSERTVQV